MFSYLKRGRGFYSDMVRLAIPIIMQNLITNSLGLIDTVMIGMLGETPLAGVTLANIPIFVVLLLVFGIQSGSSVLISQHWGKGDTETINRVVGIGFYISGGIALVFALGMFFFAEPFMGLFGNDAEVVAVAARYARIVGFSYVFDGITQVYVAAHRSMENPKLGMYLLSVAMVSNTFLNWVLIFGNLGAPALGVEGGAIATLTARIIGFCVMVVYAVTNKRFRLQPALFLRPGRELLGRFARYATPVVLNETLWGLGTSLYPTVMGHMEGSKEILAAFAISGNIEKICTVAVFAVAGTAAIIVGREIGAGRRESIYEVGAALNTVAFLAGLAVGGVMLLLIPTVMVPFVYPVFGLSESAAGISSMMLTMTCTFLAVRSFNTTNIVGVLRGGGDVRAAALLDLGPLWCCSLPLVALTGLVWQVGIFWVYLSTFAENVVKFFFGMKRFRSGEWIHDVTVEMKN